MTSWRGPLIMAGPGVPQTRIRSNVGLVDILPTLVDLANDGRCEGYPDPPDCQSLLPLFTNDAGNRIAVSELLSEGVTAPYVMLRKAEVARRWDMPRLTREIIAASGGGGWCTGR